MQIAATADCPPACKIDDAWPVFGTVDGTSTLRRHWIDYSTSTDLRMKKESGKKLSALLFSGHTHLAHKPSR